MTTRHDSQRDNQVRDFLLSIADSEGRLSCSTYAIACQLGLHRQTVSRILTRLARKGFVALAGHACTPERVWHSATHPTAVAVMPTAYLAEATTVTGHPTAWTVTCTSPGMTGSTAGAAGNETPTTLTVTLGVTQHVTAKETKPKKEEHPPAPPEEEIKQKKEKNTPTPHPRERRATEKAHLEERRQHFIDTLQDYEDLYGEEMISQFADYWTEPNRQGTRMRFELQQTWCTPRRLARWARNDYAFIPSTSANPYSTFHHNPQTTSNHDRHDKYHIPYHRPTSADFIRDAQEYAIAQTEQFVREAEERRGGLPPHLPF